MEKQHSEKCNNLQVKKIEGPKIINNYQDFINKCFSYLDSTEIYNKSNLH